MLTAICANSPFSKIVHLTLNRERYTFKERPQILLTFETFDQSDEETWSVQQKDNDDNDDNDDNYDNEMIPTVCIDDPPLSGAEWEPDNVS